MAENLGELIAKLGVDIRDLKAGLAAGRSDLASFKSAAESLGTAVKKALTFAGVAVGIWELAGALKEFAKSAALTGARTETLEVAMNTVGKSAGLSASSLKLLVEDLKAAGITTQESMSAITRSMAAGLDLSKLQELAARARDVAVVAGENTSQTMNKLIHGIISGQTEMFRTLGIPIANMEDAWKRYAAALGKTKEELTQVEKANATLNEVLQATGRFAGAAAAADTTVNKMLASLARFAEEAKNALYPVFGPSMKAAVEFMTQAWKDLQQWAERNKQALKDFGDQVARWVTSALTAVRAAVSWAVENRQLLGTILELFVVAKLTGYALALTGALVKLGSALKTVATFFSSAATAASVATAMFGAAVVKITAAAAVLGVYGAIKAFTEPDKFGGDWENAPPGMIPEAVSNIPRESPKKPSPKTKITPESMRAFQQFHRDLLDQEMANAKKKALEEAPKPADSKEKGGGAKEKAPEDFTRLIEKELKAQLDLELAKSEEALKNLKAEQDKKKAILKTAFEEGKVDGAAYYSELRRMDEEYYQGAADLIRQKIEAENQIFQQQVASLEKSDKLSPQALELEKRAMALEHQERVLKLQGELTRTLTEQERELANQTQEEARYRKEIADILAEGAEALALGPIAEKEAEINRLFRERMELKKRIPAENLSEFDTQTQGLVEKKTIGEEALGWAETFSGGIRNFVETVAAGGADITKAMNSFFKQIFSQSLEKGFKQLTQWLTNVFTELFGALGSTLANAVMGIIGLIGMLLTSGGGSKSWTPSNIESKVTSSKELRGVIAGETSLPIAEISGSLSEAMAPANRYLAEIASNTRGLKNFGINITIEGLQEAIKEAFDRYFADALMRVA